MGKGAAVLPAPTAAPAGAACDEQPLPQPAFVGLQAEDPLVQAVVKVVVVAALHHLALLGLRLLLVLAAL
jgi:hypothetical protein